MKRFDKVKVDKKLRFYKLDLFPQLNRLIDGVRENELITLAARCGCGKTSLATNLLVDLASKGKCLYVSYEMNTRELIDKINKFCVRCNKRNIFFEDRSISIPELEQEIIDTGAKFVFIDYIQLMPGKIKENTKILKELCRKYNIVIFMLSQLNRKAQEKEPNLAMISNSSTIEADSDEVGFIKQDELVIAKNRKGRTGSIDIYFNKEYGFINEIKKMPQPKEIEEVPVYNYAEPIYDIFAAPSNSVDSLISPQQEDILLNNIGWMGGK